MTAFSQTTRRGRNHEARIANGTNSRVLLCTPWLTALCLLLCTSLAALACAQQSLPSSRPDQTSHWPAARNIPAADQLIFDDEFDGNQLDLTKWYRCFNWCNENVGYSYGPPYDLEWYWKHNVSVSDGYLHLTAKKQSEHGYDYTSGVITTGGSPTSPPSFTFQYGYMEMSAKFPARERHVARLLAAARRWHLAPGNRRHGMARRHSHHRLRHDSLGR